MTRELCVLWNWRDARGRIKDFAARSLLLKMEAQSWVRLPALRATLRRGLARAQEVYRVMDGAVWLWCLRQDRCGDTTPVLDFHHASQHLWALAHHLHGEKTEEQQAQARAWVEPLLPQLRHGKENRVIRQLEELLGSRKGRQKQIRTEVNYFQTHRDHIHYKAVEERGGPIGSGAVETLCSQLQDRFKRTGQFWT